jgi:adenylate cyclase
LSSWQLLYAHFRDAEDLALIIDALRQAGVPEWPFGFTAEDKDQLKGTDISASEATRPKASPM